MITYDGGGIQARFYGAFMEQIITQRLQRIEMRLDAIEARLHLPPPAPAPPPIPQQPIESPAVAPPPSAPAPLETLRAPLATLTYRAEPTAPRPPQAALEQMIGLKLAGWIGAIVLVIGAALGVKFVYDQHWFHAVPPLVWLIL